MSAALTGIFLAGLIVTGTVFYAVGAATAYTLREQRVEIERRRQRRDTVQ